MEYCKTCAQFQVSIIFIELIDVQTFLNFIIILLTRLLPGVGR